jgi:hypothetical protein
MLVDVPQTSTDWRRRIETALVLRFRKKTQQTVMAGLDPAIYERRWTLCRPVDARLKSLSSGRAKRGPGGRA